MTAVVNGESRAIEPGTTISDLITSLKLGRRRIAVELNRDIVPAAEFPRREIAEGDQIEIVQFVGGG
jgi:thiamine biosynthesis protein ThiS